MYSPAANQMGFSTNGTSAILINSSQAVGVGTTTPVGILDVNGIGTRWSSLIVPRDTTTNRPTVPTNGMIRYNTTRAAFETYAAGSWVMTTTPVILLDKSYTTLTIASSNAENAIFTNTIPANYMGPDGAVRVRIFGTILNNTGNNRTVRIRLKFGGTTLYDDTSGNLGSTANARAFWIEILVMNAGATNAQKLTGFLTISSNGAPTVGNGEVTTTNSLNSTIYGIAGSTDTTADAVISVTNQFSASSANLVWKTEGYTVELLQ